MTVTVTRTGTGGGVAVTVAVTMTVTVTRTWTWTWTGKGAVRGREKCCVDGGENTRTGVFFRPPMFLQWRGIQWSSNGLLCTGLNTCQHHPIKKKVILPPAPPTSPVALLAVVAHTLHTRVLAQPPLPSDSDFIWSPPQCLQLHPRCHIHAWVAFWAFCIHIWSPFSTFSNAISFTMTKSKNLRGGAGERGSEKRSCALERERESWYRLVGLKSL